MGADSFVCNLGEVLELLTSGLYRSAVHRVRRPSPGCDRLSVPYFWNPSLDSIPQPLSLPSMHLSQACMLRDAPPRRGIDARPQEDENVILSYYGMNALKSLAR